MNAPLTIDEERLATARARLARTGIALRTVGDEFLVSRADLFHHLPSLTEVETFVAALVAAPRH